MNIAKSVYFLKKTYINVTQSIAYLPILISLGLLVCAWVTSYLDQISVGGAILNKMPFLKIDNADTARYLLSSLLTGLLTLVTFTFTMVMLVLAQITTSYSPRLLPDLVSRKGSQVVMGTIIGSICFIMVALSNIETMAGGPKVPVLSVLLGMYLGFASLIAFIYFIHKISNEIQIGNILNTWYRTTQNVLNHELDSGSYFDPWEEKEALFPVKAWESGYFDSVTYQQFKKVSREKGIKLKILKNQGEFVLKGEPFLEINKPLTKEIKEILEENVLFLHQENVEENFFYGFKHLTEIAVKALSPGINDPGTAIQAIHHLSDLFCRLQQLKGQKVMRHEDGTAFIIYAPVPFEKTFYLCLTSIRAYSGQDVAVQVTLVDLICRVSARDKQKEHQSLFEKELKSIEEASTQEMKSSEDVEFIKAVVQKARKEHVSGGSSSNT